MNEENNGGRKLVKALKYAFLVIWVFIGLSWVTYDATKEEEREIKQVSYSEFLKDLHGGKIDTVYYAPGEEMMEYTLYTKESKEMTKEELANYEYPDSQWRQTYYPAYEDFRKDLLESNAKVSIKHKVDWANGVSLLLSVAVPMLFLVALFYMMRNTLRIGEQKESDLLQTSDTRFENVIGHEEVLEDIQFMVEMLKNPKLGKDTGARLPRGVLFSGEPGTGKTLIAKAIAGEAGVPFLYANASSFVEMYVGVGAKRVRDLFKLARKSAPCVVFLDEIDAIGTGRDKNLGTTEHSQTLNALLQEMDGFNTSSGVVVIGATNREDALDKALLRSGRFDRRVIIAPPRDYKARMALFDYYLKDKKIDETVNVESLSKQVVGFTGADIEAIVNEAALITAMNKKNAIGSDEIEEAIDKRIFKGNRSKKGAFERDREIVAYHESGHAVMSYLLGEEIARATIVGTTSGVGGVVFNKERENLLQSDEDYRKRIMILYGGRASEEIKYGNVTTGASNDITQATQLIQAYVQKFGFDRDYGLLDIELLDRYVDSDMLTQFSNISLDLYKRTKEKLDSNYALVERLAVKLLEAETLSGDAILELLNGEEKDVLPVLPS